MNLATLATKANHFWQKNNDKILFVAGVALTIAGTGKLIADAEKIADVNYDLKQRNEEMKLIDSEKNGWEEAGETKGHYIRETIGTAAIGYIKSAGPGVAMIAGGEVLQGLAHATLTNKLISMTATATMWAEGFKEYRQNVIADQGVEKDQEYLVGSTYKHVEVKEDGTVIETTIPAHADANDRVVPNSFWFDEANPFWQKDDATNRDTIRDMEARINDMVAARSEATINECLWCIGAPRTKAGSTTMVYSENKDKQATPIRLRLLNEDTADRNYLIVIEYADGTPITDNVYESDWTLC